MITLNTPFVPNMSLDEIAKGVMFGRWADVFAAAGTHADAESAFDKIRAYIDSEGIYEAFAENYPIGELRSFSPGNKNLYYVYLSAFQKAIRYGLPEKALLYYRILCANGFTNQVRSRLRTIVLEDIGIADPFLCSLVLDSLDPKKAVTGAFVEYLIVVCCHASKSRVQTDIFQSFYYPDAYADALKEVLDWDNIDVLNGMEQGEVTIAQFMLYVMGLRGAKHKEQFPSVKLPMAQSGLLSKLYDKMGLPRVLRRLVDQCAAQYAPFAPAFIVAWSYSTGLRPWDCPFPKPELSEVDGILSAGFDQHTQTGKRSFAYVRKSHEAWFENIPDKNLETFGHIVFRVESAWLYGNVSTQAFEDLYWSALTDCWYYEDWNSDTALPVYNLVADDMSPLQKARERIWL